MATIDRFLKPLAEKRAEELHIYAGVPPTYLQEQKTVKTLDKVFTNEELQVVLREIASDAERQTLEESGRVRVDYQNSLGIFRCQIRFSEGEIRTRFTLHQSFVPESNTTNSAAFPAPISAPGIHSPIPA